MTDSLPDAISADGRTLAAQLGRSPRGAWVVADRCPHGRPSVIETAPVLADGSPFPTLYWLTCPWLNEYVDGLESASAIDSWAFRLCRDPDLAAALLAADAEYRRRRAARANGHDPLPETGIAGQADPLATKCLHAHVANSLARLDDPIGHEILAGIECACCPDDVCARLSPQAPV